MYFDTEKILSHATLEQLANYLLGVGEINSSLAEPGVRMEEARRKYRDLMERYIPDFHERDEILSEINRAEYDLEILSVMIGLQCGFSLALELFGWSKQ